jgi:hypothetical protein
MRCGKAKKILFSGCRYDDLSPAVREDLTRHMEKCGDCREIEKNIREIATEPFARAQRYVPSEAVWNNIKSSIEKAPLQGLLNQVFDRAKSMYLFRKPVFAAATAAALLTAVITSGIYREVQDRKVSYFLYGEMDFLDSLEQGNGVLAEDIGIPMEDFFM